MIDYLIADLVHRTLQDKATQIKKHPRLLVGELARAVGRRVRLALAVSFVIGFTVCLVGTYLTTITITTHEQETRDDLPSRAGPRDENHDREADGERWAYILAGGPLVGSLSDTIANLQIGGRLDIYYSRDGDARLPVWLLFKGGFTEHGYVAFGRKVQAVQGLGETP